MAISLNSRKLFFFWALISGVFFYAPTANAAIAKPANNLGLVAYWSFDEATGTTAGDHAGRGNKGTLVSGTGLPTWAVGKMGKSLSFDGGGGYVSTLSSSALNLTNSLTISAWVKVSTDVSNYRMVISKESTVGQPWPFRLYAEQTTGKIVFDFTVSSAQRSLTSSTAVNDNQWHHVVAVRDDTGKTMAIYIDGIQRASNSYSGTADTSAQAARIGISPYTGGGAGGSYPYAGSIDELRVYNRALSAAEVVALYNNIKTTEYNSAVQTAGNGSALNQGLVARYTFDGADVTDKVYDRIGNNNRYFTGIATTSAKTQGVLGQGIQFTGANKYATGNVTSNASTYAISTWLRYQGTFPVSAIKVAVSYGSGSGGNTIWMGYASDGKLAISNSTTDLKSTISADTKWHHLVVSVSGGTMSAYADGVLINTTSISTRGSDALVMGDYSGFLGSFPFVGKIDDVRVYNRALSAAEVKQLYGQGGGKLNASGATLSSGTGPNSALAAYWSFNGADVTDQIYDRVGGNNASLSEGDLSSAKVMGKLGQALKFGQGGSYTYMQTSPSTPDSTYAIALWMRYQGDIPISNYSIALSYGGNTGSRIVWIGFDSNGVFTISNGNSNISSAGTSASGWHFVVASVSGGTLTAYVDGVLVGTTAQSGKFSNQLIVGDYDGSGSYPFYGTIDEVRVYSRGLSTDEVKVLYNLGK